MEEIRSFTAIAFYFIVLLVMIRIWNRIANFIGEVLGIRKFVEWLMKKFVDVF